MTIGNERRGFARVALNVAARVVSGDEQLVCRSAKDLSMSGAYFVCEETPPIGSRCEVRLEFHAEDEPLVIEVPGDVVRHGDDGFAVRFEDVRRLDDFEKIRNLVIYRALEQVSLPNEPK